MIVVTGLMRSGTSPLAQMLHQMGIPMGTFQRFPSMGPHSHFEWEDAALAEPLLNCLLSNRSDAAKALFRSYIAQRIDASHGEQWGVKTPFLLPFLDEWEEASGWFDETVKLILTKRPFTETLKSLERQLSTTPETRRSDIYCFCERLQFKLMEALEAGNRGAETFDIQDTWRLPKLVASRLGAIAGIKPDLDVATRGIHGRVE